MDRQRPACAQMGSVQPFADTAPQLRSYDLKANPKTKTMSEKGSPLNKVNPYNLPPLTDMTGRCEVRSANKERDIKRSVQRS